MTTDHKQKIAATFDAISDTYDEVGVDLFQPIAGWLVRGLDPRPGERALDVGCGKGAVLFRLAQSVGDGGRAVGVDISAGMLDAARRDAGGLQVELLLGDAEAPPVERESFDLVSSSLVLFFLPDPLGALRAWRQALVPGGRLGVSTFGPYASEWDQVEALFREHAPPEMRDARTSGRAGPFENDEGVERLLRDAGYEQVRTEHETVRVRFDDEDQWYRWSWSLAGRRLWQAMPDDRREEVRAEAYRRLQHTRDADGRIGFDQVVRFTYGRRGEDR